MLRIVLTLLASLFLFSCATLRNSAKYDFADGIYRRKLLGGKASRTYVHNAGDAIETYDVRDSMEGEQVIPSSLRVYSAVSDTFARDRRSSYYRPSFDLDILTIPFKFRPSVHSFPAQLNTAFNGALYLGYRTDAYHLYYRRTPLGQYRRATSHYGYSAGFFTGLGATPMNPWVTNYATDREYDGLVLSAGLATIVAVNSLSFGLGVGTDRLMDVNRRHWIYRDQVWVGVLFGLNLN